jgi:hypothetical protein
LSHVLWISEKILQTWVYDIGERTDESGTGCIKGGATSAKNVRGRVLYVIQAQVTVRARGESLRNSENRPRHPCFENQTIWIRNPDTGERYETAIKKREMW